MSKWKIFYTDGSSLVYNNNRILEDVTKIPKVKRTGVHSVIQEMEGGSTREIIQQYHYLYLNSAQQWLGVGIDGLLDYLANHFEDLLCILHGRTMTSDGFRAIKTTITQDTDIIGGITAARAATHYPYWFLTNPDGSRKTVHYANGVHTDTYLEGLPWEDWVDISRHRMYDPELSPPGPYGEMRQH